MLQPKILSVKPLPNHTLRLHYETGEIKLFDVSPYIRGAWYMELKNPEYFKSVRVIDNGGGIEWVSGQDIAPHELYDDGKPYNPIKVKSVKALDNHILWVRFNDDSEKTFDFKPLLSCVGFIPLRDEKLFKSVYIDFGIPMWKDGEIDIAPEAIYYS